MTMPKGFASGKEYNYCTNCRHTEQYHRRVTPITKGTMPKGMESMIKTHNTACGLCDCDKFVDKEMQQIRNHLMNHYSSQSPQYNSSRRSNGETADKAVFGLVIVSLIAGFIIT